MQGTDDYTLALFWSAERLFLETARGLQLYFEVYPGVHPFLHGASTGAIATLMGERNYVAPSVYVPQYVLGLNNTTFPTLFIGEAWADFGFAGVILASALVGCILQLYNIWFHSHQRPHLEEIATFLAIVLGTFHLQASNLLTSFFSYGIVGNFLIYSAIRSRRNDQSFSALSTRGSAAF
jgi:hypothetical protein